MNKLSKELVAESLSFGFDNDFPTSIALIHSEVSEAFEAYRNGDYANISELDIEIGKIEDQGDSFNQKFKTHVKDTVEDELADSIIRLLILCGQFNIDIDRHIDLKRRYNKSRGYKFGGKPF